MCCSQRRLLSPELAPRPQIQGPPPVGLGHPPRCRTNYRRRVPWLSSRGSHCRRSAPSAALSCRRRHAQRAVQDRGAGFEISASLEIASIPDDAADAIAVADRRMYGSKRSRTGSLDYPVSSVLTRALATRRTFRPGLRPRQSHGPGPGITSRRPRQPPARLSHRLHDRCCGFARDVG